MKQLLLSSIAIAVFHLTGSSQQMITTKIAKNVPAKAAVTAAMGVAAIPASPAIPHKTLALYGIGNLNTETLNKVNSSGKIAVSIIPFFNNTNNRYWEIYLSFNKNASNNDSILASTLLFPEVGNHSFLATVRRVYPVRGSDR